MKIKIIFFVLLQTFTSCEYKSESNNSHIDKTEILPFQSCTINNIKLIGSNIDSVILSIGKPIKNETSEDYCGLCVEKSEKEKIICYYFNGMECLINSSDRKVCDYNISDIQFINHSIFIDNIEFSKKTTLKYVKNLFPNSFNKYHNVEGNQDFIRVLAEESDIYWSFKFVDGLLYSIELSTMC